MRKALVIHPNRVFDLGDLVAIARAEGKKALRTEKVRVLPRIFDDPDGNFVVLVEEHSAPGAGAKGSDA